MWSRYTKHNSAAWEKNPALIDSGKFYEVFPDGMQVSFGEKLSVVAVHDSCICELLFCSTRFLLFAEMPSFYGALWHHENYNKVSEFIDKNEIFEQDTLLSHLLGSYLGSYNKRSDECIALKKSSQSELPLLRIKETICH